MSSILALDFDDLEVTKPGLEEVMQLKEHYPNLKVTFFMVPIPSAVLSRKVTFDDYKLWAKKIAAMDWIEVCPHGLSHDGHEIKFYEDEKGNKKPVDEETMHIYLDAVEKMYAELEMPYQKIWKSPHWETSEAAYKVLWERGYVVAVDKNQAIPKGGPVYIYNWSVETKCPNLEVIKGHGHMYPPSANAVNLCTATLLTMPTDADFRFVSEIVEHERSAGRGI